MLQLKTFSLLSLSLLVVSCTDVPATSSDTNISSSSSTTETPTSTSTTTEEVPTTGVPTTDTPTSTTSTTTSTSDPTTSTSSTSTTGGPVCGDDLREEDEECDEGELNADDWNCMADCTINPTQRLVLDQDDAVVGADAIRTTDHAMVGNGSWCNSPGDDLDGNGVDKFEMYWDPEEVVPLRDDDDPFFYNWGPTMLADIVDVQYSTRRPAEQDGLDFFFLMYTRQDGVDDKGDFYGYRLTGVPWKALRLEHPIEVWNTFRLAAPLGDEPNVLTFFDTAFTDEFDGQPTVADIQGTMAFDWSTFNPAAMPSMIDYGTEMVRFLSLQTASNWTTFEGCADGITVWHMDGRQLIIDLE